MRKEHMLRMSENRVLRKIFGSKKDEVTGGGGDCTMGSFMVCTAHKILFG
jgi:hypothetical protein